MIAASALAGPYTPGEGAVVSGTSATFSWAPSKALPTPRYRVALADNPSFSGQVAYPAGTPLTSTSTSVTGLPNDGRTYYWRVVVENFDGNAVDFGPTIAFRSGSAACTATAISPVSGTVVSEVDSISFRFEGTGCGPETYLVFSATADLSGADDVRIPVARSASGYVLTPFLIESLPFRDEPEIYWGLISGSTVNGRFRLNSRSNTNWFRLAGKDPSWQLGSSSLVVTVQGGVAAGRMTPMTLDRIDPVGAAMPEVSADEPHFVYHHGRRTKLEIVPTKAVVEGQGAAEALRSAGIAEATEGKSADGYAIVEHKNGLPPLGAARWRTHGAESVLPVYRWGDLEVGLTRRLTAKFSDEWTPGDVKEAAEVLGMKVVRHVSALGNTYDLEVPAGSDANALDMANILVEAGWAERAQPDWLMKREKRDFPKPSDPLFPDQWHLHSDGGRAPAVVDADANVLEAWTKSRGRGVVAAVIDDGMELEHPDVLTFRGYDAIRDQMNATPPAATDAHGTAVAGVIAGRLNGIGMVGVAPESTIAPVALITGEFFTAATEANAFIVATDLGGETMNNSWGPSYRNDFCSSADDFFLAPIPQVVSDAMAYAAITGRAGLGMPLIWAAGNDRALTNGDALIASPLTLSVAATNDQNRRSHYSSYGDIDIAAPTNDFYDFWPCMDAIWTGGTLGITTADRAGSNGYNPPPTGAVSNDYSDNDYTSTFGGTSSAAPVVTGVTALMIGISPEITRTQIEDILRRTASKIAPQDAQYDANGFSRFLGYGKVNAFAAVTAASSVGPLQRRFVTITNTGEGPLVASAVRTANGAEWITRLEPRAFTLAPGGRVDVYVDFDARLAPQGTVTDTLEVVCNDPRGNVRVPLVLTRVADGSARARLIEVATGIPGSSAEDQNTDGVQDSADVLRAAN